MSMENNLTEIDQKIINRYKQLIDEGVSESDAMSQAQEETDPLEPLEAWVTYPVPNEFLNKETP